MPKEIYILSGLGADERVFQRLDFSGFSTVFVKWIVPEENETIENYATRLIDQIKTPKPTLIGLSFGGIIATEIAKQIGTEKIILISSAKTKSEIPRIYRIAGKMRLHRVLPTGILKRANFITNWFFGAKSTFEKQQLKQILEETDSIFLKWAIDKIVRWKNEEYIENTFHLHGTKDRILPLKFVKCSSTIKDGGHLMILNKAEEINQLLQDQY